MEPLAHTDPGQAVKRVLVIKSSLRGAEGASSRLVDTFMERWRERRPADSVLLRDFAQDPVPHLDAATFAAFALAPERRTPAQEALVGLSEQLIEELLAADVLVLGVPMYNKGVPSTFKSYIDHVARAGRTFRYTAAGSVGLLHHKKAYVLTARGGVYRATPRDVQEPWLREIFALMGVTDLEFVYAEGLNISREHYTASMAQAERDIAAAVAAVPSA